MSKPKVAIGYVHSVYITALFSRSVLDAHDRHDQCPVLSVMSGPNLSKGRNLLSERFLDKTDADYLFMVDTDMVFSPTAIERLMEHDLPFTSGLCLTGTERPTPSMYRKIADSGKMYLSVTQWNTGELLEVDAVGSACMLIHREVFEKIREQLPNRAAPWFQELQVGSELVGEDFTFCDRAREVGYKILVDTSIQIAHIKPSLLGGIT